ncbi:hypothetical protein BJX63DRAFT_380395 [Aspergillus granulosus]|uniref:Uncharacterized protein n=1 Tax=Aspergillus granulosus TaxID=176169 RepID=A0ABR4HXU7_9EURO
MAENIVSPPGTIRIFVETGEGWVHQGSELAIVNDKPAANVAIFWTPQSADARVGFADQFQRSFRPVIDDDLNGTFHCQYDYTGKRVTPRVSWSCFKLKQVRSADKYSWKQPSLHITWDHQTGRQVVYIFHLPSTEQEQDRFLESLPSPEERKHNPFFWHAAFSQVVLEQYDIDYWLLRKLIRDHEKNRHFNINNRDFFPELHDIARHAFHYNEIIDVAENTLNRLIQEQIRWREEDGEAIHENIAHWLNPHQELLLQQKGAVALKARSKSLNERLLNEINLGFNLVLQEDSTMMKTIAFVSMVYLPGTFVSGVFGTNFFDFDSPTPGLWDHSHFWLYWAVAVPLTVATMASWAAWHRRTSIQKRLESTIRGLTSTGVEDGNSAPIQRNGTGLILPFKRATTAVFGRRNVQRQETV